MTNDSINPDVQNENASRPTTSRPEAGNVDPPSDPAIAPDGNTPNSTDASSAIETTASSPPHEKSRQSASTRNRGSSTSKRQSTADLPADIDERLEKLRSALGDPVPEQDAEPRVIESFVTRQYEAECMTAEFSGTFARNEGLALVKLKSQIGHGGWEAHVEAAYQQGRLPFSLRTARDRIAIALNATAEEAETHNAIDLLAKIGRAHHRTTAIEEAAQTLDRAAKSIRSLSLPKCPLLSALRKLPDPSFVAPLESAIGKLRDGLDGLESLLAEVVQSTRKWNESRKESS